MHVGMASVFQNPQQSRTDRDVYRNELRLADLAEPLGFESVWGVEHHFTDYTMCPDVLQFLTYVAGRTQRAQLGSMVVVLPWHDPMRVAEEVSMLDNISDGVRRHVRQAAARGDSPGAVQVVPRPHLRRRRVTRLVADHGAPGRGHPDHSPEAVARGRQGARDVSRRLSPGQRR